MNNWACIHYDIYRNETVFLHTHTLRVLFHSQFSLLRKKGTPLLSPSVLSPLLGVFFKKKHILANLSLHL